MTMAEHKLVEVAEEGMGTGPKAHLPQQLCASRGTIGRHWAAA